MTENEGLCLVPWLGGKQAMVDQLLPLIPKHTCYVEVFGGGAALLLNKPVSQIEVFNDINGDLVNLFEVVRNQPDAFLTKAEGLLYSRELFEQWSNEIINSRTPADSVERALRFWYCVRSSFGGKFFYHPKGWAFARRTERNSPEILWRALASVKAISQRLRNVEIDCLDFKDLIANHDEPETFFYLDPPYYGADDYLFGKERFPLERHYALAKALREMKGKWLLTVGNHPATRDLYTAIATKWIEINSKLQVRKDIGGGTRDEYVNLVLRNYLLPGDSVHQAGLADMLTSGPEVSYSPTERPPEPPPLLSYHVQEEKRLVKPKKLEDWCQ